MNNDFQNIADPVTERRMRSGSIVRFLYACAIVIFIGILSWNFARGLLFLEGTGTISAKKMVIAYPFPVRIKSVNVTPGSDVKAGDVLATIESFEVEQLASRLAIQISELTSKLSDYEIRLKVAVKAEEAVQKRFVITKDILAKLETGNSTASSSQYKMQVYLENANASENYIRLSTEKEALVSQIQIINAQIKDLIQQQDKIYSFFEKGQILAKSDVVIGGDAPMVGQVFQSGEALFNLYDRNDLFVVWEMPLRRFVEPAIGDRVYITSGYFVIEGHIDSIYPLSTPQGSNRSVQYTGVFQGQTARVKNKGFDKFLPIESQVVVRMNYTSILNKVFAFFEPHIPR